MRFACLFKPGYRSCMLDFAAQYEALPRRDSSRDGAFFSQLRQRAFTAAPFVRCARRSRETSSSIPAPLPRNGPATVRVFAVALRRHRLAPHGKVQKQPSSGRWHSLTPGHWTRVRSIRWLTDLGSGRATCRVYLPGTLMHLRCRSRNRFAFSVPSASLMIQTSPFTSWLSALASRPLAE